MQEKKIPYWWSLLIALIFPILQVLIFLFRFRKFNTLAPPFEYPMFYLAGLAGGLLLIFFLRHSKTGTGRWVILGAYLLATPLAIFGMVGGGLLGPVGVLLFSVTPWALFMWFGYLAGAFLPK